MQVSTKIRRDPSASLAAMHSETTATASDFVHDPRLTRSGSARATRPAPGDRRGIRAGIRRRRTLDDRMATVNSLCDHPFALSRGVAMADCSRATAASAHRADRGAILEVLSATIQRPQMQWLCQDLGLSSLANPNIPDRDSGHQAAVQAGGTPIEEWVRYGSENGEEGCVGGPARGVADRSGGRQSRWKRC